MTTLQDRMEISERINRTAKMAATYLRKASNNLYWGKQNGLRVSTDYWTLLDQALEVAVDIVEALPDDFYGTASADGSLLGGSLGEFVLMKHNLSDDPLEKAEAVVAAMRGRRARYDLLRKIEQLESVTGRTPEEAAIYLGKARELREQLTTTKEV